MDLLLKERMGSKFFHLRTDPLPERKQSNYDRVVVHEIKKKIGKRKVQEVPQSQAAALPRQEEAEETDKTK